jgi:hypothetical protein
MKGGRLGCWRPEELAMNKKNEDRGALIDRMLEARSEQEVEAAEKDAEGWLKENPCDIRVIAASGRLAKTGARSGAQSRVAVASRVRGRIRVGGIGGRRVDE